MPKIPVINPAPRNIIVESLGILNPETAGAAGRGLLGFAAGAVSDVKGQVSQGESQISAGNRISSFANELAAVADKHSKARKAAFDAKGESLRRTSTLKAQDMADQAIFKLESGGAIDPEELEDMLTEQVVKPLQDAEADARANMSDEHFVKFQQEVGSFFNGKVSKLRRSNFGRVQEAGAAEAVNLTDFSEKQIASAATGADAMMLAEQAAEHIQTQAGTILAPAQAIKLQLQLKEAGESRRNDLALDAIWTLASSDPALFADAIEATDVQLTAFGVPEETKQKLIDDRIKQMDRLTKHEDAADARADEELAESQEALGNEMISSALEAFQTKDFAAVRRIANNSAEVLGKQKIKSSVATQINRLVTQFESARTEQAKLHLLSMNKTNPVVMARIRSEIYTNPAGVSQASILAHQATGDPRTNLNASSVKTLLSELSNIKNENHFSNSHEYKSEVDQAEATWDAIAAQITPEDRRFGKDGKEIPVLKAGFFNDYNQRMSDIAGEGGFSNPRAVAREAKIQMDNLRIQYKDSFKALQPLPPIETEEQSLQRAVNDPTEADQRVIEENLRRILAHSKRPLPEN